MDTHPTIRIAANHRLSPLGELPRYAGLLYFLVWRDVKVRYKQTALGVLWAILQPAGIVAAASLAFSRIAPHNVPYPLFVAAGVVPWQFFSRAVTDASVSPIENERLLTKVYFPRILLPLAAAVAVMVETSIAIVLLVLFVHIWSWHLLMLIPALLIAVATATGIGAATAAMNVRYRDFRYMIPFLIQVMFLLTPVLYPPRAVPDKYRPILELNPLAGALETVRWSLFGTGPLPHTFAYALITSLVLFVGGVWIFRAGEDAFADVI
ncbi:MAG: ABC transporter permease [Acidobacteriota bacterium]|nr:ABC transporter permease [Acidobacteriota bacterium]